LPISTKRYCQVIDNTTVKVGVVLASLFGMTTIPTLPNNLRVVADYYMPGRREIEPGTNALVGGAHPDEAAPEGKSPEALAESNFFGADGLSFGDLLDILNPLQHIPMVGDLYRSITGDEISSGARISGGTLYGGPMGFVSALANTVVEEATGMDIGANLLAQFSGDGEAVGTGEGAAMTAEAATAPTTTTTPAGLTAPAETGEQLASLAPEIAVPAGQGQAAAAPAPAAAAAMAIPNAAMGSLQVNSAVQSGTPQPHPTFLPAGEPVRLPRIAGAEQNIPQLSPAAFRMLMSNVNSAQPAPARQGLTAGAELPPVHRGSIREAGLEINQLLRDHAQGRSQPQNLLYEGNLPSFHTVLVLDQTPWRVYTEGSYCCLWSGFAWH
jgi:hypothetical protein